MEEQMLFENRTIFREWLSHHVQSSGTWLIFGKSGGPATLSRTEALEEALCFGWIDGQIKSLDEKTYAVYFSPRRKNSPWSQKNKGIVQALEEKGLMTEYGRAAIEEAKRNGRWDAPARVPISDEQISLLIEQLKSTEPAYTNFMAMSPSVKRTYTGLYLDAKTEEARKRRLERIVERLNENKKPM